MSYFFLFFLLMLNSAFSQSDVDKELFQAIDRFNFQSIKKIESKSPYLYSLGEKLFSDPILSLNQNISCLDCHNPNLGTTDQLPTGFGEGFIIDGNRRLQGHGTVMKRNAPSLFNLSTLKSAFWDGRILKNEQAGVYITPDKGFEKNEKDYFFLNKKLLSPIAVQALFPLVEHSEMRGHRFNHLSNLELWNLIVKRIKSSSRYSRIVNESFSIADLGNALSEFQSVKFQTPDTNWDRYISGEIQAMSLKEKRGALIFAGKARCANCHNGPLLSNNAFQNIAAPQIINLDSRHRDDLGRFEAFNDKRFIYSFKTQPLRNIALTAPYTHSGSLLTLEEVVEHYNDIPNSLSRYNVSKINRKYQNTFHKSFVYESKNNKLRISRLSPPVRAPLGLNRNEKSDLVCFLKRSLTQRSRLSLLSHCR